MKNQPNQQRIPLSKIAIDRRLAKSIDPVQWREAIRLDFADIERRVASMLVSETRVKLHARCTVSECLTLPSLDSVRTPTER